MTYMEILNFYYYNLFIRNITDSLIYRLTKSWWTVGGIGHVLGLRNNNGIHNNSIHYDQGENPTI